jgi:predicted NUDIX family NTP pyrophosphohydrolase
MIFSKKPLHTFPDHALIVATAERSRESVMARTSAGIVAFRRKGGVLEVLLVHPGGPFWRNKDEGAWSIPKGEYAAGEHAGEVARREFREELGIELTEDLFPLGEVRQRGGKVVSAFAVETDLDAANIQSNTFEIEWPARSGRREIFPEVDRAAWFEIAAARVKINDAQRALLDRLETSEAARAK